MANIANVFPAILITIIYLAIIIFIISLAVRLVRAVEEIANKAGSATRMLEVIIQKIDNNS
jgi:Ca2+/H+ antiporter